MYLEINYLFHNGDPGFPGDIVFNLFRKGTLIATFNFPNEENEDIMDSVEGLLVSLGATKHSQTNANPEY